MEEIVILGAGGFAREVQWWIERINQHELACTGKERWNLIGFIDIGEPIGTLINGMPVIGDDEYLINRKESLAVVCATASPRLRKKIIGRVMDNAKLSFPNLIDPSAHFSKCINWGKGNIICANTIITVNISLADFCIVNLSCTIGHDVQISSYVTVYPTVNISGNVNIGECVEIGTGSQIIQGKTIGQNAIIGAGSVVVKDIPSNCTALGVPCKAIKFNK